MSQMSVAPEDLSCNKRTAEEAPEEEPEAKRLRVSTPFSLFGIFLLTMSQYVELGPALPFAALLFGLMSSTFASESTLHPHVVAPEDAVLVSRGPHKRVENCVIIHDGKQILLKGHVLSAFTLARTKLCTHLIHMKIEGKSLYLAIPENNFDENTYVSAGFYGTVPPCVAADDLFLKNLLVYIIKEYGKSEDGIKQMKPVCTTFFRALSEIKKQKESQRAWEEFRNNITLVLAAEEGNLNKVLRAAGPVNDAVGQSQTKAFLYLLTFSRFASMSLEVLTNQLVMSDFNQSDIDLIVTLLNFVNFPTPITAHKGYEILSNAQGVKIEQIKLSEVTATDVLIKSKRTNSVTVLYQLFNKHDSMIVYRLAGNPAPNLMSVKLTERTGSKKKLRDTKKVYDTLGANNLIRICDKFKLIKEASVIALPHALISSDATDVLDLC